MDERKVRETLKQLADEMLPFIHSPSFTDADFVKQLIFLGEQKAALAESGAGQAQVSSTASATTDDSNPNQAMGRPVEEHSAHCADARYWRERALQAEAQPATAKEKEPDADCGVCGCLLPKGHDGEHLDQPAGCGEQTREVPSTINIPSNPHPEITEAVGKVVAEYGPTLNRLAKAGETSGEWDAEKWLAERFPNFCDRISPPLLPTAICAVNSAHNEAAGRAASGGQRDGKPTLPVGVSVLITNGNLILLGERINNTASGLLSTPGGRVEQNEDIIACAVRETMEETGLSLSKDLLKVIAWREHFRFGQHYIMFYVHAPQSFGTIENREPDKCKAWGWRTISKVKAEETTEPLEVLALLAAPAAAPELSAQLQKRETEIEGWLYQYAPEVFKDQNHLDETVASKPTQERKYWHYGYLVALRDALAMLRKAGGQ